jgi:orotate phosphoribosyltransferase
MTDAESRLLTLLRERSYQQGEFRLSSGDTSDYYFDAKMALMSSEGASLVGDILYQRTKDLAFDAIGGLEIGAIPLTTAVVHAYHRHGKALEGFFVRNEAKKHGTKKIIEGRLRPGSKVVIVDDVATKGTSIGKAIDAVRKAECEPILVLVLMDRLQGASALFQKMGIPFVSIFTSSDFR